jgi:hypothetical protein
VHSAAPFAVLVVHCTIVLVALLTTILVFAAPVTVSTTTPAPSVTVWYFVLVETGNVVLIVDVTSEDWVM